MSGQGELSSRLRAWLRAASALWIARGIGAHGLFHERLFFDAVPDADAPLRVLVQGRQLFVLARAAEWGVPGAAEALARALPAVIRRAWAVDGAPGWIHVLAPDGTPRDLRRDTYDQSFLLFGLAACVRAGLPDARAIGEETWRFVDGLRDGRAGGYLEGQPALLPRRSNPHMHLLEAALAWFEATGEGHHLERADAIGDLLARHFLDRETGTLGEFFDDDLRRLRDARGESVEPGHMFEWSWLLHRLARAGGRDWRSEALLLHRRAVEIGLDAAGFAVDEADRDGRVRRTTRRAWPQTELIKSAAANGDTARARDVTERFLATYLATKVEGLWIDQFDAAGMPMSDTVPASTFYHIVVAFEDLVSRSG
jgi:mannose/cellobiose epimerase-like protein (N-acyl-D-glucosamine 2-epimerase family)